VRRLAEALRSELSAEGIGVSVVYPPDTDTPGYREELHHRPEITHRLSGTGGLMTADAVAAAMMRGIARGRFTIAPSRTMAALA
jgi:3-dehydrosphinganine reductase